MTSSSNSSADDYLGFNVMYASANCINLILALPTNGYIVWLIATGAPDKMASEFFALNLALSEILFCLGSVLIIIHFLQSADLGTIAKSVFALNEVGRPLFMCLICVECYLAVVHPVVFLRLKPLRYRLVCSGLAWLAVAGFCVFYALIDQEEPLLNSYMVVCLSVMLVILFCCLSVLRALKRARPGDGEKKMNSVKRKAFKIILLIMLSFTVTYFITFIVIIVFYGHWYTKGFLAASGVSSSINVMSGIVQPLLFLQRTGKLPVCTRL